MRPARGATRLAGVLLVDKPAGMTSHDVVNAVRRATGERRIGHAGTLDPMATGLLVVLVGPYTRLEPYLSAATKTYQARIAFGAATDTDDAEGAVLETAPVPAAVLDPDRARALLDGFLGESMQAPPAYSAIKVGGRVAHRVARAGGTLAVEPRPIVVEEAELTALDATARTWDVRFTVSKGSYIRALARDAGRAAGTVAHLSALRRTRSGAMRVEDAHPLAEVVATAEADGVATLFADPLAALALPVLDVDGAARASVASGSPLPAGDTAGRVSVVSGGRLLAVYERRGDELRPLTVLAASS